MKEYLSSYPELVKEWHPTKNRDLTTKNFTYGSNYKACWFCAKGHSYQSSIKERTRKGKPTGCSLIYYPQGGHGTCRGCMCITLYMSSFIYYE